MTANTDQTYYDNDGDVFSENQGYFTSTGYGLIGRFMDATDPETLVARRICQATENETLFDQSVWKLFPPEKVAYHKAKRKNQKMLREAERKLDDLREQQTALTQTKRRHEANGNNMDAMRVNQTLTEISSQIAAIVSAPAYVKGERSLKKKYVTRYNARYMKKFNKPRPRHWASLRKIVAKKEKEAVHEAPHIKMRNLMMIADYLKLEEKEKQALQFMLIYSESSIFRGFINLYISNKDKGLHLALSKIYGWTEEEARQLMNGSYRMFELGLAAYGTSKKGEGDASQEVKNTVPSVGPFIQRFLTRENFDIQQLTDEVGQVQEAKYDWDDDAYAEEFGIDGKDLLAMLEGYKAAKRALKEGKFEDAAEMEIYRELTRGVNILFAGIQDAGKTEAVYALCKKAGLTPISIGEPKGSKDKSLAPEERLARAMLAAALFGDKDDVALVLDEMVAIIPVMDPEHSKKEGKQTLDKLFINRFLENNGIVTFYTENDASRFHPSIMRRMAFSRFFGFPTRRVRRQLLTNMVKKYNLNLTPEQVERITTTHRGVVGTFATAARATRRAALGQAEDFDQEDYFVRSIRSNAERQFGSKDYLTVNYAPPADYNLGLFNAMHQNKPITTPELKALVDKIKELPDDRRRFSMVNEGPPGTGKDEFIMWLADQMGMETLVIEPSDILDMWVGGNEENIANAFNEAEEKGMFLLFKEGDTYLRDRSSAQRSWESSMVNQMLVRMERATCPFAISTNSWDVLDNASYRRFTMRLGFDFLNDRQRYVAFRHFFGMEAPEGSLERADRLTPGDFAKIKRDSKIWGTLDNVPALVVSLIAISEEKPPEQKPRKDIRPMGFGDFGTSGSFNRGGVVTVPEQPFAPDTTGEPPQPPEGRDAPPASAGTLRYTPGGSGSQ